MTNKKTSRDVAKVEPPRGSMCSYISPKFMWSAPIYTPVAASVKPFGVIPARIGFDHVRPELFNIKFHALDLSQPRGESSGW